MAKFEKRTSLLAGIMIAVVLVSTGLLMAGCDLMPKDEEYEPKENEVLVSASTPAGPAPAWVEVRVQTNGRKEVGFGVLSLKNGKYSGYIQVVEAGAMKFIVTTGLEMNDKVQWIGSGVLTVQGKGQSMEVSLSAPVLGGVGSSGGRIFYDKGNYDDGWRYLEAYAAENGFCQWATARTRIPGSTDPSHGAGKPNTALMSISTSFYPAAGKSTGLTYGNRYDWFLPSIDELETLLNVLGNSGFLTFNTSNPYWSSTEGTTLEGNTDKAYVMNVRPNPNFYFMEPYIFSKGTAYKDISNGLVIGARRF